VPESYGEKALRPEWNGDRIRDDYEISLLRSFMAMKKPVLGVCRGAQVINVGLGGTLYQDLATQAPHSLNHRNWEIYEQNCHATSFVPAAASRGSIPARRRQDQLDPSPGGEGLGRDLVVEAWSEPDRIVEAIRYTGPAYVFAVQWHPEFHAPDDPSFIDDTPILDDFLAAASQHKAAAYTI
jgi:putative glutamine amidotransferase